jgi:short-subunit dehydrogenase
MARSSLGTALITGASAGIGAVYADRLARRGCDLILVARDKKRLADLATELRTQTGVAVQTIPADLTYGLDTRRIEERLRTDPSITLLVNNAGMAAAPGLMEADQGEVVTIPALPNRADWEEYTAARLGLGPNLSRARVAGRYQLVAA